MTPIEQFSRKMANVESGDILYTGAKPWEASVNPDHSAHAPHCRWIGTDIEAGEGVQIVADLHTIDVVVDGRQFDAIFSPATLEHLERPWIAMRAMARILKPGGVLFVHTHQTFPLHGYPSDFYRFSEQALRSLCADVGLVVLEAGYDHPCTIKPPSSVTVWNTAAPAFLNVNVCAVKPHDHAAQ